MRMIERHIHHRRPCSVVLKQPFLGARIWKNPIVTSSRVSISCQQSVESISFSNIRSTEFFWKPDKEHDISSILVSETDGTSQAESREDLELLLPNCLSYVWRIKTSIYLSQLSIHKLEINHTVGSPWLSKLSIASSNIARESFDLN